MGEGQWGRERWSMGSEQGPVLWLSGTTAPPCCALRVLIWVWGRAEPSPAPHVGDMTLDGPPGNFWGSSYPAVCLASDIDALVISVALVLGSGSLVFLRLLVYFCPISGLGISYCFFSHATASGIVCSHFYHRFLSRLASANY